MPNYLWKCDTCEEEVSVIKSIKQYNEPPTEEELKDLDGDCEHVWKRILSGFRMIRGEGWRGSKGNWLYVAGIIGVYCEQISAWL